MKTTLQQMVVQLPGHAPLPVHYYFSETSRQQPLVDVHVHFIAAKDGSEVHLTESIQRKAAGIETVMQVVIAEMLQEYLHQRR